MNKNNYLNKKINDLNESEKYLKKKKNMTNLVIFLALGIIGAPAYIMANNFGFYPGALALGCWDILVATLGYSFNQDKKSALIEIEQEKKHLKKIKQNKIKSNKDYDKKRLERIEKLEQDQEDIANTMDGNSILGVFGIIASTISSIGIIINPEIGSLVSIVSLLTTIFATNNNAKNGRKYAQLEARITNLRNDIELGSIFGYDPSKKESKSTIKQLNNSRDLKALGISKDKEKLLDSYIELLAKNTEKEVNKSLIK